LRTVLVPPPLLAEAVEGLPVHCVRRAGGKRVSFRRLVRRALAPRRGECANLLVPVCLSASHIAYGSIRMEPVFFALGQVAGTAAAQAVADGCAVQDVDYGKLRERLVRDGMVLE